MRKSAPVICYSFGMALDALTKKGLGNNEEFDARCLQWIQKMSAGNEQALGEFYDATLGRVFGVAVRIIGNSTLAEDVVSDVYHEAWKNAARYDQLLVGDDFARRSANYCAGIFQGTKPPANR